MKIYRISLLFTWNLSANVQYGLEGANRGLENAGCHGNVRRNGMEQLNWISTRQQGRNATECRDLLGLAAYNRAWQAAFLQDGIGRGTPKGNLSQRGGEHLALRFLVSSGDFFSAVASYRRPVPAVTDSGPVFRIGRQSGNRPWFRAVRCSAVVGMAMTWWSLL